MTSNPVLHWSRMIWTPTAIRIGPGDIANNSKKLKLHTLKAAQLLQARAAANYAE